MAVDALKRTKNVDDMEDIIAQVSSLKLASNGVHFFACAPPPGLISLLRC
jgi:hypothetical protein